MDLFNHRSNVLRRPELAASASGVGVKAGNAGGGLAQIQSAESWRQKHLRPTTFVVGRSTAQSAHARGYCVFSFRLPSAPSSKQPTRQQPCPRRFFPQAERHE